MVFIRRSVLHGLHQEVSAPWSSSGGDNAADPQDVRLCPHDLSSKDEPPTQPDLRTFPSSSKPEDQRGTRGRPEGDLRTFPSSSKPEDQRGTRGRPEGDLRTFPSSSKPEDQRGTCALSPLPV
uniref:Uncharacterized protein n=1 Tax=Knipowitschia caucasica TaxID=637954 RepID=A0AAV2KH16_KNICA